jgi:hypothetical protein
MLKKVVLAAAATAVIAGATITAPVTADAAMTCEDAAKMKYPDSIVDRMKYKRECKKAYKTSMGKEGPLAKIKAKMSS